MAAPAPIRSGRWSSSSRSGFRAIPRRPRHRSRAVLAAGRDHEVFSTQPATRGEDRRSTNRATTRSIAPLREATSPDLVSPDILNIGVPIGVGTATLGTQLQKMGRTTGYTTGQITQIDVTVSVDYGGKLARLPQSADGGRDEPGRRFRFGSAGYEQAGGGLVVCRIGHHDDHESDSDWCWMRCKCSWSRRDSITA